MLGFFRFRLFRRPPIATIAQHERVVSDVIELFRMPIEDELCAPAAAARPGAKSAVSADSVRPPAQA